MGLNMKDVFESIVGEGWNPDTGSVSDFTPIKDGIYEGVVDAIIHADHDNGESVSITIKAHDENDKEITPRAMLYVSNTLEQEWEVSGAKKLIKTLSKLGFMVGVELDEDDFEDLSSMSDLLADVVGEELSIELKTVYNKKKKKDNQNAELIFPEFEYNPSENEVEEEEVEEETDFTRDEDKEEKPKSRKSKSVTVVEEDDEEDDDEEAGVEDEEEVTYDKEFLNGLKIKELKEIAEEELGLDIEELKKKKQLIDAILAEV